MAQLDRCIRECSHTDDCSLGGECYIIGAMLGICQACLSL
ncbi:hypothetical protein EF096_05415 [Pseudomonas neustonica]|uniref:Uncharacterized protein n=1 Tax=Pseudomonas neustonica TaxID=2487346 RepID=A0ABX9XKH9_9PSED|nr:hypothetical protein EF099_06015 [Pseudomonas sp. SSM44]ROZ86764.1 hypothetical protein EF096_05415 [Pseudomonas neustonica]